ncbi:DUF1176 domain-containing protein [Stenotrophomonas maltophilia]|uniref:DUF1176 domain-containing protein n=1 Tax=Stenotrophomonas maltophilia TaxID=40324 RepID=UPI0039F6723C
MQGLRSVLALLPATLAMTASAAAPLQQGYGDWQLNCDNRNDCVAIGRAVGYAGQIRILRDAGIGSPPTLELFAPGVIQPRWKVDGASPAFSDSAQSPEPHLLRWTGLAQVRARLHSLHDARVLQYGQDSQAISLAGLSAVLTAFDQAQGRTGSVDALLPGRAAASAHPRGPLPLLQVAAASTRTLSPVQITSYIAGIRHQQAAVLQQRQCDADDDSLARPFDQAFALDADNELVFIGCQAGMYNANVVAFVVGDGRTADARALQFPVAGVPPIEDGAEAFVLDRLGWARFDTNSQRLTETTFHRGIGDCGHAASWRWDGHAFQIETVQLQPDCNGGDPGNWPTLWRTASSPDNVARQFGPLRGDPAGQNTDTGSP